jgi:putative membrane protein
MSIIITWALYTAALALVAALLPGFEVRGGLKGLVGVAALFGVLNWALGWLLTLVLTIVTLGLAWLLSVVTHTVVTAIVLKITDAFSERLRIRSFWTALLAAAIMSVTVGALRSLVLR